MFTLFYKKAFGPVLTGLVGLILVLSFTGLVLWADATDPEPDPDVRVNSFYPQGETDPAVNITVKFSNSLVPDDSLRRPTGVIPVRIKPEINALARWTETNVLTIYPGQPLDPATEYEVTINSGGGFVNGNAIRQPQKFNFHTPRLSAKVARYQAQRSRENNREARLIIELDFNYPVSREQLKDALTIHGIENASQSNLSIVWPDTTASGIKPSEKASSYRLSTEPFELKNLKQRYQLVVDNALSCVNCGQGLDIDYSYMMSVGSNLRYDLRVNEVQAVRAGKQGMIAIRFSSPVPDNELNDRIRIEPAIPFSIEGNWWSANLIGNFEPQTSYTITVIPGIMSRHGELMDKEFSSRVVMGDIQPGLRFTSQGLYLPSDGSRLLEVNSINIDTLSIEVSQIFSNNLVTYLATNSDNQNFYRRSNDAFGRRTFVKDFPLNGTLNKELYSTIDIGSIVGDSLQGVFIVSARNSSSRWLNDTRHVMMTDIGIMARMSDEYLMVWSNSLSESKPVTKARVKVYSRNNQLLVEGKTNSKGVAVFTDVKDQFEGYRPFLITIEKGTDLSYLRLDNSRHSLSDFDVTGRPYLTDGYESFIYMDRGVFRPGEKAHLVSIVRGRNGVLPGSFPYFLKIKDPRGRTFREYRMTADKAMESINIELPADAKTGKYTAVARLSDNYILGQTDFLVEDFVPDRMKVTVQTDRADYDVGDTMKIDINGQMLYGAPAAKLKVASEVVFSPEEFRPFGYSAFSFGIPNKSVSMKRVSLGETRLSDSGTVSIQHIIGTGHRPPGRLSAKVWATVSETGGRAVSSYIEAKVNPYRRYVGIGTELESYAKTGEPVQANIITVLPDGSQTIADSIRVLFTRIVYNSMLKKLPDGSYRFQSEQTEEPIDSLWISVDPEGSQVSFTPHNYGRYRIIAQDVKSGHSAATDFFASGWGRVPWSLEQPDRIQLDLDRDVYSAGTRAKLQIRAPFKGRLLITVENQTVQDYMVLDLPENTGEIEIPIEREYAPNVYISATLIRPGSEIGKGMPARAYGLIPLQVISENRQLDMSVSCPEEMRPNSDITLDIQTNGTGQTRMTVAAVDVGVLQLTGFTCPNPFEFFYGKRRPALDGYDLYSLVYPESERSASHLSPPGGKSDMRRKQHLNPFQARRIRVVSLWSGIVDVDSAGKALVNLHIPQFNGQLQIMAVAADGDRFSSATASLTVREPIILQESFPRFIAPDDEVHGLVTVFNGLDTNATIIVQADIKGHARLIGDKTQSITLQKGQQGVVTFPFTGTKIPGKIEVNLEARADSEQAHVAFEMANRPAYPLATRFGSGVVTSDSSVNITMPNEWVEGTDNYILRTSSLSALQMTRNIEYLLRYPYGCLEQTTSRLFPLLYFDDLAKVVRPELLGGKGHEYFLSEGIEKILRFQKDDGAFSYWPWSIRFHHWSSIYAGHFLVEARLAGYEVENSGYKKTIQFLERVAKNRNYTDIDIEHRIYACLVLAKAGKLDGKLFNFLSEINTKELPVFSRYQLASTLALAGDIEVARNMVPFDIQPDMSPPETGRHFSSGVRTDAILLDVMQEVDPQNPSIAVIARSLLERANLNRWHNTQATAFALMALGKYFNSVDPANFSGEISINQKDSYSIDTSDFVMEGSQLDGKEIEISIDGTGPCFYYWQTSGVPLNAEEIEYDRGILVRREYLDGSGSPVDQTNIELGSQLVCHISIQSTNKAVKNVVIADLLPAGMEIENSRLANSPIMPWIPGKLDLADYEDIRDDRILKFVDLPQKRTLHFYYSVRVIAEGEFVIPPVMAECMYNPLIAGAGSSGRMKVTQSNAEE